MLAWPQELPLLRRGTRGEGKILHKTSKQDHFSLSLQSRGFQPCLRFGITWETWKNSWDPVPKKSWLNWAKRSFGYRVSWKASVVTLMYSQSETCSQKTRTPSLPVWPSLARKDCALAVKVTDSKSHPSTPLFPRGTRKYRKSLNCRQ